MKYTDIFHMPNPVTIMARTSSITNSFVNGIIPCIPPTEDQIKRTLNILGMDAANVRCAYCGEKHTEWDHFRPLVIEKRPTGYITEINNLVPACGKCNQSKGNKYWKEWMLSDAKLSPKSRNVPNLDLLVYRLEEFERQSQPVKIDFAHIVGQELWEAHWDNCEKLHSLMRQSQCVSDKIRDMVRQSVRDGSALTNGNKAELNNQAEERRLSQIASREKDGNDSISVTQSVQLLTQKKVGWIVQNDFRALLESDTLPNQLVLTLQNLNECKNVFGLNFPVLKKLKNGVDVHLQRKDHLGRDRYYAEPITIGKEKYLLTSQWYERHKPKLIVFLATHC